MICSLVCKQWHRIINQDSFLQSKLGTVVRFSSDREFNDGFKNYANREQYKVFQKLCLQQVSLTYLPELWDQVLPELTHIEINHCKLTAGDLWLMLSKCRNVESVSLIKVFNENNSEDFLLEETQPMENVKVLCLRDNHLTSKCFPKFIAYFTCLKKLEIAHCKFPEADKFDGFQDCMNKLMPTLKQLSLHCTKISLAHVWPAIKNLSLCHLDIGTGLSEDNKKEDIIPLLSSFPELQCLGLGHAISCIDEDNDPDLIRASESWRYLKEFEVSGFGSVHFQVFANLESLTNLTLDEALISADIFRALIKSGCCKKLKSITLLGGNIPDVEDYENDSDEEGQIDPFKIVVVEAEMIRFFEMSTSLTNIAVSHMKHVTSRNLLRPIIQNARGLRTLDLSHSDFSSRSFWDGGEVTAQFRERLRYNLEAARTSRKREADEGETRRIQIDNLRNLSSLNVERTQLDNVGILRAFKFHNLRYLNVSGCDDISDSGFQLISEYNRSLEDLLMANTSVTNQGMEHVIKNLPRLRTLDISHCEAVSISGLYLMPKCSLFLRKLVLTGCSRIRQNNVKLLTNSMNHLRVTI